MGIFTVENDAVQDPVRLGYEGEPTAQHAQDVLPNANKSK